MTTWFKDQNRQLLIGLILLILPLFYFLFSGVSLKPLNPHEHLIQNGLAYVFLVAFSYINHTVFVPRWFLNKQYKTYLLVAASCVLVTAYLPYRIEQWAFFKPPRQNTVQAWARQLFVEEMMLSRPDELRPSDRPDAEFADRPPRHPPGSHSPSGPPPPRDEAVRASERLGTVPSIDGNARCCWNLEVGVSRRSTDASCLLSLPPLQ